MHVNECVYYFVCSSEIVLSVFDVEDLIPDSSNTSVKSIFGFKPLSAFRCNGLSIISRFATVHLFANNIIY